MGYIIFSVKLETSQGVGVLLGASRIDRLPTLLSALSSRHSHDRSTSNLASVILAPTVESYHLFRSLRHPLPEDRLIDNLDPVEAVISPNLSRMLTLGPWSSASLGSTCLCVTVSTHWDSSRCVLGTSTFGLSGKVERRPYFRTV